MVNFSIFLMSMHIIGLAIGVGSATVKLILALKAKVNYEFLTVYFKVNKIITRFIISGFIILIVSGIGLLLIGYSFTPLLQIKVVLVILVFAIGPLIDNVYEPKFEKLFSQSGETGALTFARIQNQHLALEVTATMLMYVITIMGVLL
jgi:hypothetical protein